MNIQYITNIIKNIFKCYIIYALIFGLIIFGVYRPKIGKHAENHSVSRFWGNEEGQDRVALVEERYDSGLARMDLIENAEETLDISYYTIHDGISTDIFLGSILDAADRGVKVRFLIDGVFHNLRGNLKGVIYAFSDHPNIELKLYEPINLIKPWTLNNRLHDKFIISDSEKVIIGGRNIGDKYFDPDENAKNIVNDRDVVILNTNKDKPSNSAVSQTEDYFNLIWNSEFSKYPVSKLSSRQEKKGEEKSKYLIDNLEDKRKLMPEIFNRSIDWLEMSVSTNKITLVHNPIEGFKKEPWTWYELISLAEAAEESIFVQSPYTIPTKSMRGYWDFNKIKSKEIYMLTNSLSASPNYFASSGYKKHRKRIVDSGVNVYEFQGPGSIHAKTYIYDNRIAAIGSFNLDGRSTHLSTETMVIIDSVELVENLEKEIGQQMNNSLKVDKDYSYVENPLIEEGNVSFIKSIIVNVLFIVNYFFDFML